VWQPQTQQLTHFLKVFPDWDANPGSSLFFYQFSLALPLSYSGFQVEGRPIICSTIGLHHPLDGVTNPEYKLLHFLNKYFSLQIEEGTSF
jgi:hypothetical protein